MVCITQLADFHPLPIIIHHLLFLLHSSFRLSPTSFQFPNRLPPTSGHSLRRLSSVCCNYHSWLSLTSCLFSSILSPTTCQSYKNYFPSFVILPANYQPRYSPNKDKLLVILQYGSLSPIILLADYQLSSSNPSMSASYTQLPVLFPLISYYSLPVSYLPPIPVVPLMSTLHSSHPRPFTRTSLTITFPSQ
jgi:hypothetical protein